MEQVAKTDTAQRFVGKINDNFEEAGIVSSLSYSSRGSDFVGALNTLFAQPNNAISVSDNGNDFVRKINENFENLVPIVPGEARVITMAMQAGQLDNGYSKDYAKGNSTSISSDIWRYMHSTQLLGLTNCTIHSVSLQSGESLSISYYNENGEYLGTVSSVASIPSTAKFVRFQVSIPTTVGDNLELRNLEITITGVDLRRKNGANATDGDRTRITFEVKKPYKFPTGVDYIDNDRIYDNGYIVLPNNQYYTYSPIGTPTDLAVFIQGTGGFSFNYGTNDNTYRAPNTFIAQNNIAVCCCSGVTSRYSSYSNLMFAPLFMESIASMVDYIKANYNIGRVYLYGKSSGGMMTNFAPLAEYIGAKCVGSLAPAFCPTISQLYAWWNANVTSIVASEIGVTKGANQSWKDAHLANIGKWRKVDAFFASYTSLSDDDVKNIATDGYNSSKRSIAVVMNEHERTRKLIEGYEVIEDGEVVEVVEGRKRLFPVPHRIWCAKDDNAVDYYACEVLCNCTYDENDNKNYSLIELPSGTGQHNADTGTTVEHTLPNGTTVQAYIAYSGLVNWFKSHSNTN